MLSLFIVVVIIIVILTLVAGLHEVMLLMSVCVTTLVATLYLKLGLFYMYKSNVRQYLN